MSLVQAYIYKDFILVGGEQKAKLSNGEIRHDFIKVRRINDSVIIGMSGTIEGNAKLFSQFINPNLTLKEPMDDYSYSDIIQIVKQSYYDNWDYLQEHDIHSVVCGWDGEKFTGFTFFTKDSDENLNHPIDLTPESENEVKVVNCGLKEHYIEACRLQERDKPSNIAQFKNLFKNVIDNGIKFDDGINKNITFEKIKRSDVI